MSKIIVSYPSWEDRSSLSFSRAFDRFGFEKAIIIKNLEPINNEGITVQWETIVGFCTQNGIETRIVKINQNPRETWYSLCAFKDLLEPGDELLVDVSTMSRNVVWTVLSSAFQVLKRVSCIYSSPKKYTNAWISREPETPQLLYKHSGVFRFGMPMCLIIVAGFDKERVRQLISYYEPEKVIIFEQGGGLFNNENRGIKEDDFIGIINNVDIIKTDFFNSDYGLTDMEKVVSERVNKYNVIVASLGPKTSAVGIYKIYLKHPEIALSYVPCREYNINYCNGIGSTYDLEILKDDV